MYKWLRITDEVHRDLTNLGRKGETFDTILRRVLSADQKALQSEFIQVRGTKQQRNPRRFASTAWSSDK